MDDHDDTAANKPKGSGRKKKKGNEKKGPSFASRCAVWAVAWSVFAISAVVALCGGLTLIFGVEIVLGQGIVARTLEKIPVLQRFVLGHSEQLAWLGISMAAIASLAALGLKKRKRWGYLMLHAVLLTMLTVMMAQVVVWLACETGLSGNTFQLGRFGGWLCLAGLGVLASYELTLRVKGVKKQFAPPPKKPNVFVPGLVMLTPADLKKKPPKSKLEYSEEQIKRAMASKFPSS
jgi:hypothetical protein